MQKGINIDEGEVIISSTRRTNSSVRRRSLNENTDDDSREGLSGSPRNDKTRRRSSMNSIGSPKKKTITTNNSIHGEVPTKYSQQQQQQRQQPAIAHQTKCKTTTTTSNCNINNVMTRTATNPKRRSSLAGVPVKVGDGAHHTRTISLRSLDNNDTDPSRDSMTEAHDMTAGSEQTSKKLPSTRSAVNLSGPTSPQQRRRSFVQGSNPERVIDAPPQRRRSSVQAGLLPPLSPQKQPSRRASIDSGTKVVGLEQPECSTIGGDTLVSRSLTKGKIKRQSSKSPRKHRRENIVSSTDMPNKSKTLDDFWLSNYCSTPSPSTCKKNPPSTLSSLTLPLSTHNDEYNGTNQQSDNSQRSRRSSLNLTSKHSCSSPRSPSRMESIEPTILLRAKKAVQKCATETPTNKSDRTGSENRSSTTITQTSGQPSLGSPTVQQSSKRIALGGTISYSNSMSSQECQAIETSRIRFNSSGRSYRRSLSPGKESHQSIGSELVSKSPARSIAFETSRGRSSSSSRSHIRSLSPEKRSYQSVRSVASSTNSSKKSPEKPPSLLSRIPSRRLPIEASQIKSRSTVRNYRRSISPEKRSCQSIRSVQSSTSPSKIATSRSGAQFRHPAESTEITHSVSSSNCIALSPMSITSLIRTFASPSSQEKRNVKSISKQHLKSPSGKLGPQDECYAPRRDIIKPKQRRFSLTKMPVGTPLLECQEPPLDDNQDRVGGRTRGIRMASYEGPLNNGPKASLHSSQNEDRSLLRSRLRGDFQEDPFNSSSLSLTVYDNPRDGFLRSNSVPILSGNSGMGASKKPRAVFEGLICMPSTSDFVDSFVVSTEKDEPNQKQRDVEVSSSHHSIQLSAPAQKSPRRRKRSNSDVGLRLKWSSLHDSMPPVESLRRFKPNSKHHTSCKDATRSPYVVHPQLTVDAPPSRDRNRHQDCSNNSEDSRRNKTLIFKKQHSVSKHGGNQVSASKQSDMVIEPCPPRRLTRAGSAPPFRRLFLLFDQAHSPLHSRRQDMNRQCSDR